MLIGEQIKQYCKEKNIHVNDLAIQLDTSAEYVYRIFKKDSISTELLIKISNILNVPTSKFFDNYQGDNNYSLLLDFVIDIFKDEKQEIDISFLLREIYRETQKNSKLLKEFITKNVKYKDLAFYFHKYQNEFNFDLFIMFNEGLMKSQFKKLKKDELIKLEEKYSNFNVRTLSFIESVDFYLMNPQYEYLLSDIKATQIKEYDLIYKKIEKIFIDNINNNEIIKILKNQDPVYFWKVINYWTDKFYEKYNPFPK